MHIVIISRSYPNRINTSSGNFVQNQVEALSAHSNLKIGVVGVYNVSLKALAQPNNIRKFGFYQTHKKNIKEYTYLYPVIPKMHFLNHKNKFRIWKALFKRYIAKNGKPDIVHLHTFEAGNVAMWIKKEYGIPYIVTEHTTLFLQGIEHEWHSQLAVQTYAESDYNIAVSEAAGDFLTKKFNKQFHYLPNFVNTKRFIPATDKKKQNIKRFINVAYLDSKKNQAMLIKAFHKAFANNPDFELSIVGKGVQEEKLKNLIKSLNATNIKLLGYITQDNIVKLYQQSDYFALSSDIETFGVVIIEAMSCGLPVIATSCGGPESIIKDQSLGFLSPVNDMDAFSDSLLKLVETSFDTQHIRNYAINNFSYDILSNRLIEKYKSFIK